MNCCGKCSKMCGYMILGLGILFLLQDLNVWNFWGISWYTAILLIVGFAKFGCGSCPDCKAMDKKK